MGRQARPHNPAAAHGGWAMSRPEMPMLEKRPSESEGKIIVTFTLPGEIGAGSAAVVGEFNGWSHTASPMRRMNGDTPGFVASIVLEGGRAYRFRYLMDGERWENDWAADDYVPNQYGGNDSVVDLRMHDPEQ